MWLVPVWCMRWVDVSACVGVTRPGADGLALHVNAAHRLSDPMPTLVILRNLQLFYSWYQNLR